MQQDFYSVNIVPQNGSVLSAEKYASKHPKSAKSFAANITK